MHRIMAIMLYTKVDAQCDKLATAVGRTNLTTLATVNVLWQKFSKSTIWDKVVKGSTLISEGT